MDSIKPTGYSLQHKVHESSARESSSISEPKDEVSLTLKQTIERYHRETTEGLRNKIRQVKAEIMSSKTVAYAGSMGLAGYGLGALAATAFGSALAAAGGAVLGIAAGVGIGKLITTPIKHLFRDNTPAAEKVPAGSDLKMEPMKEDSLLLSAGVQNRVDEVSSSRVTGGNRVELLRDGVEAFPERYALMEKAEKSINLQTLIFHDDETGWKTADLLVRKAKEGVKCRVIYDWMLTPESKIFNYMKKNGVEVHTFNTPLDYKWHKENTKEIKDFLKEGWEEFKKHLGERNLKEFASWAKERQFKHLKFWYNNVKGQAKRFIDNPPMLLNRLNNRWHQKILTVDNKHAIVGGMNLGSDYAYGGTDQLDFSKGARSAGCKWTKDTDVRVDGPAIDDIIRTFSENWEIVGGKNADVILTENPPAEKPGDSGTSVSSGTGREVTTDTRWIATRPLDKEGNFIENWYCEMLEKASETAYITTAYFIPNERLTNHMIDAARRGVDVRILTNSKETNNHPYVTKAGRSCYPELLQAGVRIYEKKPHPSGILETLHSKVAVFDGQMSTVGSHNINSRSLYHDSESTMTVHGREFGKQMLDMFRDDLENSEEVTLDDLKMDTPMDRLEQWFYSNVVGDFL